MLRIAVLGRSVEVETGEGAECVGFEGGLGVREGGRRSEFGVGLRESTAAGEQQAESDVRGGEGGAGSDGFAVGGLGVGVGGLDGFQGEAEVVEDLRVAGGEGVEVGEDLEGGGEVAGGEGVVGLLDQGGRGGGLGVGVVEVLCVQRGGYGGQSGGEQERGCAASWLRSEDEAARRRSLPPSGLRAMRMRRGVAVPVKMRRPGTEPGLALGGL